MINPILIMIPLNFLCFILSFFFTLSHCQLENPIFTSLKTICDTTMYPRACYDTLSPLIDSKKNYDSKSFYNLSIQVSIDEISRVSMSFSSHENGILTRSIKDTNEKILISALESCHDFLSLAMYNLNSALTTNGSTLKTRETRTDFRTWLSAAGADLQTCMDGFEYAPDEVRKLVTTSLDNSTKLVTNSLAIISKIDDDFMKSSEYDWESIRLSPNEKKPAHKINKTIKPHVVVARDGSGNYKTIVEALNVAPRHSNKRFVIYVKKGVYNENVRVDKEKWNVLMYGDGMEKTVVSGNRSNRTGSSTSLSATFAAYGKGFMAKDMGFRNTAGATNHQAVALFSSSDQSVFYRCLIDGYQDTLYAHSHRQFYRECKIYGTIDFIFGDAAVVIQKSNILVKKPSHTQTNIITAQGKNNPYSNSGISIQKCSIVAAENLSGVKTFLGRPWGAYSTVVIMQSHMSSFIDPKGWSPWHKNATAPDTVSYVEHKNVGPGAATNKRVRWKGLRINDAEKASKFTVRAFIGGDQWLSSTGVPFQADM